MPGKNAINGITWDTWRGSSHSLRSVKMILRPARGSNDTRYEPGLWKSGICKILDNHLSIKRYILDFILEPWIMIVGGAKKIYYSEVISLDPSRHPVPQQLTKLSPPPSMYHSGMGGAFNGRNYCSNPQLRIEQEVIALWTGVEGNNSLHDGDSTIGYGLTMDIAKGLSIRECTYVMLVLPTLTQRLLSKKEKEKVHL